MHANITIKDLSKQLTKEILEACFKDEIIARIFINRGYTDPLIIRQMINTDLYNQVKLHEFKDMTKAVDIIIRAIFDKKKICVYGDYDVDGVTSTVTLVECIRVFSNNVTYHVPDRFYEGYGMNINVIKKLYAQDVELIITCDCGISNIDEISYAKSLGMKVIVTDHHNIKEQLPNADAILNPKLLEYSHPAREISGCAMAYYLASAILLKMDKEEKIHDLLDLLAMSIISDVVPINGENRYLLKKAMPVLFETKRPGLRALFKIIEQSGQMSNEEDIAFKLAPRINAAGRMDSARIPVDLFLSDDIGFCRNTAKLIDSLNEERKIIQNDIINEAISIVETQKKNKTILVLFNDFWHHGITGIAAGRICEIYKKPTILMSMKGDGTESGIEDGMLAVGSARSVDEINIYELLNLVKRYLVKFGGHAKAAGLSIKKEHIESFTIEIERICEERYFIDNTLNISVDMELDISNINDDLYQKILSIGPFGEGFQPPLFYSKNVLVLNDNKTDKNHHIMEFKKGKNETIRAVWWFGGSQDLANQSYDFVYKVSQNSYNNNSHLQLNICYGQISSEEYNNSAIEKIIDARKENFVDIIKKHRSAEFFYEGLNLNDIQKVGINRYNLKKNSKLVMLSPPLNTDVLRDILLLVKPSNIIINFSIKPDYSFNGFVNNLLGIIKHVIKYKNSTISIKELTSKLCVEPALLLLSIKFIEQLGKVSAKVNLSEDKIQFLYSFGKKHINYFETKKHLVKALEEKRAYQNFILNLEIDKFKEYLSAI